MKIKLGVIFGGQTVEHEVSIISAVQAMKSLDKDKYDIIPIYVTKDLEWYTGEILKQMDTYTDMDLLKRYTTNVVLYNKKGHFYLQSKGLFKRIKQEIDKLKVEIALTNKELDMFRNETRKKLEELETRMKIITMAITTLSAEQNDTREIVVLLVKEVGTMGNRENK